MFRWILPALLSGITAVVAFLPLGWVAGLAVPGNVETLAPELDYHGTLWNGTVSGLPIFGTANLDITPLSRRALIQSGEGQNYLSVDIGPSLAKDIDLRINLATLPFTDGRLKGLRGTLNAQISNMEIDNQSCVSAAGTVTTDVLQRNGGTVQWTGPELTGPIRCEEGALIADFSGRDAQQNISALIRMSPDRSYRVDITVRTNRAEADAVLPIFGFTRSGKKFVLVEQGRWR